MKKLFAVTLLIVMLCQALPLEALAAVGNVLSQNEIERARALTGLSFGREQNGERAYHSGMKPNKGWNAVQLRGWLDEKLDQDLDSICDTFSHAFYALADLENTNSPTHRRLTNDVAYNAARTLYMEAEALREELRYCRDKIREDSGVIAEMSRWLTEESSRIFDSDKVRYSARIAEAQHRLKLSRDYIADNADHLESRIARIKWRIQNDVSYGFDEIGIKTWLEAVLRGDEVPVTRTAPVTRTSAAASRRNRLQMASGLVGDADAQITVYTDNEVVIQVQAESGGDLVPVDDAKVTFRDALDPASEAEDRYPDKGVVLIPINNLTSDEYDVYHLAVDIDGTASG